MSPGQSPCHKSMTATCHQSAESQQWWKARPQHVHVKDSKCRHLIINLLQLFQLLNYVVISSTSIRWRRCRRGWWGRCVLQGTGWQGIFCLHQGQVLLAQALQHGGGQWHSTAQQQQGVGLLTTRFQGLISQETELLCTKQSKACQPHARPSYMQRT